MTVISKNDEDDQYIWESTAKSDFKLVKDPRGNTLGRGTEIILHLKPEETKYEDEKLLRKLVAKYSEFVNFPIYLWATNEVVDEISIETPLTDVEKDADTDTDMDDSDVEDVTDKENAPTTEKVTRIVTEWFNYFNSGSCLIKINQSGLVLKVKSLQPITNLSTNLCSKRNLTL